MISESELRLKLAERLRGRRWEIEGLILARVRAGLEPSEAEDGSSLAGLRAAVAELVEDVVVGVEGDDRLAEPLPAACAAQVQKAARHGVSLEALLRRYAAVERVITQAILEGGESLPPQGVRRVLRARDAQMDRYMAGIASEHEVELARLRQLPAKRLGEQVERLLSEASYVDPSDLGYEFEGWHLGLVGGGAEAEEVLRAIVSGAGHDRLVVPRRDGTVWAWIAAWRPIGVAELRRFAARHASSRSRLAVGESRRGLEGWRLTHAEARVALPVALRRPQLLTRGSEVLLLAAVLRDRSLARALHDNYIAPLDKRGNPGATLRQTLSAYFAADGNAAAAGAALKVTRQTVQRRLRRVESSLGRVLHTCRAEVEVALLLEQLENADRTSRTAEGG